MPLRAPLNTSLPPQDASDEEPAMRVGALPKDPSEREKEVQTRIQQLIHRMSTSGQIALLSQLLIPPLQGAPWHLSVAAKREILKEILALPPSQAETLLRSLWADVPPSLLPDLLREPTCPANLLRAAVRETTPSDWTMGMMISQKKEELVAVFQNPATPADAIEDAAGGVLARLGVVPTAGPATPLGNTNASRPPAIPKEAWADLLRHPRLDPLLRQRIVRAIYQRGATAHRAVVDALLPATPGHPHASVSPPPRIPCCDVRTSVRLIELREHVVVSDWPTPVIRLVARRLLTEVLRSTDAAEPKGVRDQDQTMSRVPLIPSDLRRLWHALNEHGPAQTEADRLLLAGVVRLPFEFLPRDTAGAGLLTDVTRQQALLEDRALWKRLLQSATRDERVRALQLLGEWEARASEREEGVGQAPPAAEASAPRPAAPPQKWRGRR